MNGKARFLGYLVLTMVPALGAFVLFAGCQKDEPTAGPQTTQTKMQETAVSASMKHEATSSPAQPVVVTAEQTTCPVMGGAINKAIFVEHQGKKVYFCCNGCPDTFKANPEKYIAKLPQFAK